MADRWEYQVLETDVSNQWRVKKREQGRNELQARLNDLGAEGWEMVGYDASVNPNSLRSVGFCFLKRRVTS